MRIPMLLFFSLLASEDTLPHRLVPFEVRWHPQRRLVRPLVLWGHQGGPPWALWPVGAAGEGAMWTQASGVVFFLTYCERWSISAKKGVGMAM